MGVGDFFGTRAGDLINYAASKVLFASFFLPLRAPFFFSLSLSCPFARGDIPGAAGMCVSHFVFLRRRQTAARTTTAVVFYTSAFELLRMFLFSSLFIFVASFTGLKCV